MSLPLPTDAESLGLKTLSSTSTHRAGLEVMARDQQSSCAEANPHDHCQGDKHTDERTNTPEHVQVASMSPKDDQRSDTSKIRTAYNPINLEDNFRNMVLGNQDNTLTEPGISDPSHPLTRNCLSNMQPAHVPVADTPATQHRQRSQVTSLPAEQQEAQARLQPRGHGSTRRQPASDDNRSRTGSFEDASVNRSRPTPKALVPQGSIAPSTPSQSTSVQSPPDAANLPLGHQGSSNPNQSRRTSQRPSHRATHRGPPNAIDRQAQELEKAALTAVSKAMISEHELQSMESFRATVEVVCRQAIGKLDGAHSSRSGFDLNTVQLVAFGSLSSGFALTASDMDLMLISPHSRPPLSSVNSPIPRELESVFLERGWGARLLTQTRVPIIRLCEWPTEELLDALLELRGHWELGITKDTQQPAAEAETGKTHVNQEVPSIDVLLEKVKSNRQYPEQDIRRYFQNAKQKFTALEQAITKSGSEEEKQRHSDRGEIAAMAFINGLSDDNLRQQVLDRVLRRTGPPLKSLAEAWIYVESEEIFMAWTSRSIKESSHFKETTGEKAIQRWMELGTAEPAEGAHYEEEIHKTWHRLKVLPSAKLETLSQWPHEQPKEYHARCEAILHALGSRDMSHDPAKVLDVVQMDVLSTLNHRLVKGIEDMEIQQRLMHFYETGEESSFKEICEQHEAEHRIRSLNRGIKQGLYPESERQLVDEYAALVRKHGAHSRSSAVRATTEKVKKLLEPTSKRTEPGHWTSPVDFPKSGVGIQCDINFSNQLALHNTLLLRCYSHCDARVKPMVLAIKAWAKLREINCPYRGTLSSYGYVLMVLHFLANIADPPVVPNLQLAWKPTKTGSRDPVLGDELTVCGRDVRFWRDEEEIKDLARQGLISRNQQSLGHLLRQFFQYYSSQRVNVTGNGFCWSTDTLSIRTSGGLISKRTKGWTEAKVTVVEPVRPGERHKEIRHRYLLAIEDPFETDHNIARTVNHHGIVAIRDEFRRAWRTISNPRKGTEGIYAELFHPLAATNPGHSPKAQAA